MTGERPIAGLERHAGRIGRMLTQPDAPYSRRSLEVALELGLGTASSDVTHDHDGVRSAVFACHALEPDGLLDGIHGSRVRFDMDGRADVLAVEFAQESRRWPIDADSPVVAQDSRILDAVEPWVRETIELPQVDVRIDEFKTSIWDQRLVLVAGGLASRGSSGSVGVPMI